MSMALASPVDEAADIVGLKDWPERIDTLETLRVASSDADSERWTRGARSLRLLAKFHPHYGVADLRDLMVAALGDDADYGDEAVKAARLGVPLPERAEGSDWMARIPHPSHDPIRWSFEGGLAEEAPEHFAAVATGAGYTAGEADTPAWKVVFGDPEPAVWGETHGTAVRAEVTNPDGETFVADGFAAGPWREGAHADALSSLAGNVLSGSAAPGEVERVKGVQLCLLRRFDSAQRDFVVRLDRHYAVPVSPGTWGCLNVPVGTVLTAEEGRAEVKDSGWYRVAGGSQVGWAAMEPMPTATAEKWKQKGKVREATLEVVHAPKR